MIQMLARVCRYHYRVFVHGLYPAALRRAHHHRAHRLVQLTEAGDCEPRGRMGCGFLGGVVVLRFAFSIGDRQLGCYAESNVQFIKSHWTILAVFRMCVLGMVYFARNSVPLVWDMADLSMGMMALINLVAILALSPLVFMLLKDYQAKLSWAKSRNSSSLTPGLENGVSSRMFGEFAAMIKKAV